MTSRKQRARMLTPKEARELLDRDFERMIPRADVIHTQFELARIEGDLDEPEPPPLVQDSVALSVIDANAPAVPYPLLNADRQTVPIRALVWWLFRLVWWRWKSRHSL